MARDPEVFIRRVMERLGRIARERVKAELQAIQVNEPRSLRKRLEAQTLADKVVSRVTLLSERAFARLSVPHYWAVAFHDGRPAFGPKRAKVLVWFARPEDDPRLRFGLPVREEEVLRLNKQQYKDGLARNAANLGAGLPPFMFVARIKSGDPPRPFFTRALESGEFARQAEPIIAREFETWVASLLPTRKSTATGRL